MATRYEGGACKEHFEGQLSNGGVMEILEGSEVALWR